MLWWLEEGNGEVCEGGFDILDVILGLVYVRVGDGVFS